MKRTAKSLDEMLGPIPDSLQKETDLSFQISDRIFELMQERGLSKNSLPMLLANVPAKLPNGSVVSITLLSLQSELCPLSSDSRLSISKKL